MNLVHTSPYPSGLRVPEPGEDRSPFREWETVYGRITITLGREMQGKGEIRLDIKHDDDTFFLDLGPNLEMLFDALCRAWEVRQSRDGTAEDNIASVDVFTTTRTQQSTRMANYEPVRNP